VFLRRGETCGAVTGAFMVLGLKYAGPHCDISTPAGAQKATQEGLFQTICSRLVQDAAEILEKML